MIKKSFLKARIKTRLWNIDVDFDNFVPTLEYLTKC